MVETEGVGFKSDHKSREWSHSQILSFTPRNADDYLANVLLTLKSLVRSNSILEIENAVHDRHDAECSKSTVHVFKSTSIG